MSTKGRHLYSITFAWNENNLLANLDSALIVVKSDDVLFLHLPQCQDADSNTVKEAAGRFTPWHLKNIAPSGSWQWDRPLVIILEDSASCPRFLELRERRWTEFVILSDSSGTEHVTDMIRRYKRERVDRMEEMFRK